MLCISVKIMVISVRQKTFYSQPFLKMRKFLLDMRKDFLIMSNFYLVEILSEPNSLTIVTSKTILKMSNYVRILSISFSHNGNQEFALHSLKTVNNSNSIEALISIQPSSKTSQKSLLLVYVVVSLRNKPLQLSRKQLN